MTIEQLLQNYYYKSGATQPEIALALKVSQSTVHKWLSGKAKIPLKRYQAICRLCGGYLHEYVPSEWFPAAQTTGSFS